MNFASRPRSSTLIAAGLLAAAAALLALVPSVSAQAPPTDPPARPQGLTGDVTHDMVTLSWDDPGDDTVTSYQVLRRSRDADTYGDGQGAAEFAVVAGDTGSADNSYVDRDVEPDTRYVYRIKARNAAGLSVQSSYFNANTPAAPATVEVEAVPIVVTSTTDDYFVLYVQHQWDENTSVELPVLVKEGEAGTTTLAENLEALPKERYRVEKYLIASPADIDGDGIDDISDPNPVNPAPAIGVNVGAIALPDLDAFDAVARGSSKFFGKFIIFGLATNRPGIYFQNTNNYVAHTVFLEAVDMEWDAASMVDGFLYYDPDLTAPDGSAGLYYARVNQIKPFNQMALFYTVLGSSVGALNDNLALHIRNYKLPYHQSDLPAYRESRVNLVFDTDVENETNFQALNEAEGYGLLRVMDEDDHPRPRDIAIYETLPNELPRVAGIVSTVQQTPLSHVNLRAVQDGVPNAYIRNAVQENDIASLIGSHVHYIVTVDGYTIRAATRAEVDAHYAASRPATAQTPERDLSVTAITALSQVGFGDWDAFGVKAANVAVLGTLGFPAGTVPDGFAIPFYFYDEFMKANNLYADVREMLADADFQSDYDEQEDELKKLRKKIKKADTPQWIIDALTAMHATYPDGQSLRYRSSTNNEDLPGFNGAGLYDSKTQKSDETVEDGIDKSLKQVYASLWNFRAFTERDFHRIDHLSAAMGVLVHPNYTDELVNGVAVSEDTIYSVANKYYINSQVGEDLVTNPDAHSIPEEILLDRDGTYEVLITSNQVKPGQLLMTKAQIQQLRRHLGAIHNHFKGQYNPAADEPFAMEIEFKITSANILAIKQARPWVFDSTPASNSAGTVALSSTQPRVDTPLTATLTVPDGVSGATTWAWHRSPDGTSAWAAITGAASASYTPVTADVGRYLRATASYTDDADNAVSLTSAATEAVLAADSLTASALGVPTSHDGSTTFTFELRFSEEIVISYSDFSGSVFQITGGTVQKARRLAPPSNIGWEITVEPTGNGNVVITLPGSRACDVVGAICTSDGDQLSGSISVTVSGPAPTVPAPAATIAPGTSPVAEGAAASFTVSLDGAAPATLSVAVSVADTDGVLSDAAPTSIAFAAGDDSKTLTLPTRDDDVIKTASTVTVSLVTGSGYTLGTTTSASVSVTDDDTATWTVSAQPTEIDEGESATITVAVANGKTFASNQTISLAASGTAASSDYSLSATELTLRAGSSSATATVTATDDAIVEGDETVTVTASHDGQSISSATVTISDTDDATWTVSAQPTEIDEGESATITVAVANGKTFASNQTISLAASGTAASSDYSLSATELTLRAGSSSATATVTATDDVIIEDDETVTVTASHGGQSVGSATVTISDDDATWTVSAQPAEIDEGESATVTVAVANGRTFASNQTISLAVSGTAASSDYSLSATELTLRAGESSATAIVTATDDVIVEGDETVIVTASHGGQSIGSATVTISDNDDATWRVSAQPTEIDEGGSSTITVAVANGKTFASNQTISLAVSGTAASSDYSLSATELRAGESSATAIVTATDDVIVEGDETVIVTASHGGQSIGSATVTISDNDDATWTVSAQPTEIDEGESSTVTVAVANGRTFASNQTISLAVSGTAASSDYSLSATELTLRAGAGSATATVTATDDVILEGGETVTVTASHGGQSVGSATITIEANDTPLSNDATLSSLVLSGVDIGAFNSGTTGYSAIVGYDVSSTTVTADPSDDGASVTIADANGSTQGTSRAVSLSSGDNVIIVTVTAEDGTTTKVYTVTVARAEPNVSWGQRLPDRDIALDSDAAPTGLWSDGANAWVITDCYAGEVNVYALSDGSKQDELSFTLANWSGCATALWSNGTTVWVANFSGGVRAYRLSDGARQSDQDLDLDTMLAAGNIIPSGLWSNGELMWVADYSESKVFAYRLSDGARVSARDFDLKDDNGVGITPFGLWSNGETLLASSWSGASRVLAYTLSDGLRQTNRDIDTSASGTGLTSGIWSDGETLWVVDDLAKRIYAYAVPGLGSTP